MKNNILLESYIKEYIDQQETLEEGKLGAGISTLALLGAFLFGYVNKKSSSQDDVSPERVVDIIKNKARKRGNNIDEKLLDLVRQGAYNHKKLQSTIEEINQESEKNNEQSPLAKAFSVLIKTGENPENVSLEHGDESGIASVKKGWNKVDKYLSEPTLKNFMNAINIFKDYSSKETLERVDNPNYEASYSIKYNLHKRLKKYIDKDLDNIDSTIDYLKKQIENDPDSDYYERRVKSLERLENYKIEANNALENISRHYGISKDEVTSIILLNNDHEVVFNYFREELEKNQDYQDSYEDEDYVQDSYEDEDYVPPLPAWRR
tara:strand:- start:34 stop:996 length:963 start_codon:yes stop_codon:yes gene_type:complete